MNRQTNAACKKECLHNGIAFLVFQLTVYKMIMQINSISEYIIMYLNRPNDVTKAQRPSSAKCFMQVIFSSFDVNGAATDASAYW